MLDQQNRIFNLINKGYPAGISEQRELSSILDSLIAEYDHSSIGPAQYARDTASACLFRIQSWSQSGASIDEQVVSELKKFQMYYRVVVPVEEVTEQEDDESAI